MPVWPLSVRTPSMYTSGVLRERERADAADADLRAAPTCPVVAMTFTPGARPLSRPSTVGTAVCADTSAAFTDGDGGAELAILCAAGRSRDHHLVQLERALSDLDAQSVVPTCTVSVSGRKPRTANVEHDGRSR